MSFGVNSMTLKERNEQIYKSFALYRETGDIEHYRDIERILKFYKELEEMTK